MGLEYDIGVNLTSAGIGAALGSSWMIARSRYRYRHNHRFWKFIEDPTIFVVGDLQSSVLLNTLNEALKDVLATESERSTVAQAIIRHVQSQELSGLMGRGDFEAIVSMVVKFASLRLPVRPKIVHSDEIGKRGDCNLVLIGGPDVNKCTSDFLKELGCKLQIKMNKSGRNVVEDCRLQSEHGAGRWCRTSEGDSARRFVDYGILARGTHPDNPKSEVLIIAGAHGFGTLAAAEVSLQDRFQKRLCRDMRDYAGQFECLVRYERLETGPADVRTIVDLELSRQIKPRGGAKNEELLYEEDRTDNPSA